MIINTDWYNQSSPEVNFDIRYKHSLNFSGAIPQTPMNQAIGEVGCYTEGLWERDVAELFVANTTTGQYIEINIAANGSWWLMLFDQPRQKVSGFMTSSISLSLQTEQHTNHWTFTLDIPQSLLISLLGEGDYRYNVCFILGNPRQYLSLNSLGSKEPDFHRPQDFVTSL
ncbi:MAG: hypothetical protein KAH22_03735 [Thiotrichaceae bacterium]|nr:hypothetical protein [Thiotrichaceae bacterium]